MPALGWKTPRTPAKDALAGDCGLPRSSNALGSFALPFTRCAAWQAITPAHAHLLIAGSSRWEPHQHAVLPRHPLRHVRCTALQFLRGLFGGDIAHEGAEEVRRVQGRRLGVRHGQKGTGGVAWAVKSTPCACLFRWRCLSPYE